MPKKPKPRPVGRPKLPKEHSKSTTLLVRLSSEERQKLELAAKEKEKTLSAFTRSILIPTLRDLTDVVVRLGTIRYHYVGTHNLKMVTECDRAIEIVQSIAKDLDL
jgi:hypothetical protein